MTALVLVCIVATGAAAFGVAVWVGVDHNRRAKSASPPNGVGSP